MFQPTRDLSLRIDRFMRLARRTGEVWQGGGILLPFFQTHPETGEPVRQAATAWANLATDDLLFVRMTADEARDHERVLAAFLDFGLKNRKHREGRPSRIEVRDEATGLFIKNALQDAELEVAVVDQMPAIDDEVARVVAQADVLMAGPLDAPGVTEARLRAFAEAAARLRAREIWHDIGREDFVLIESPTPPEGMAGFVADLGDGNPILEFYESREQFDRQNGNDLDEKAAEDLDALVSEPDDEEAGAEGTLDGDEDEFDEDDEEFDFNDLDEDEADLDEAGGDTDNGWHVEFVRLHELPPSDVPAWADRHLPVATPDGYPVALREVGYREFERPDASRLAFLEGLLRVLGETTEAEIDGGRWTRTVETADGPVTYRLALLSVLDEASGGSRHSERDEKGVAKVARLIEEGQFKTMEEAAKELVRLGTLGHTQEAASPLEEAENLVYSAAASFGRRRIQLLRKAIDLWPDCFQAYLQLAEIETRPALSLSLFETGRAAAERVLADRRDSLKGRYWDDAQGRMYLRLRIGLAMKQRDLGRAAAAVSDFRELLDLDPGDRAGVRNYLLPLLLGLGRNAEAEELASRFESGEAVWHYGRALLEFRRRGKSAASVLDTAFRFSPLAAEFLAEELLDTEHAPAFASPDAEPSHDEEDEAEECVELLADAWAATPGATEWLAAGMRQARRRDAPRGRRRR